ncbi:non-ribosomal peptide synthetase [Teichococcus aestuarii]|uniref:non-ribosomal peptide synthetase n=1 Tax=Teichococcus aestuarii TaxID=568898 RepID=UPI00361200CC
MECRSSIRTGHGRRHHPERGIAHGGCVLAAVRSLRGDEPRRRAAQLRPARAGRLPCQASSGLPAVLHPGGGKLPQETVRRFADFAERHGRRFYVMYGQTEAAPRIAYVPPALVKQYPVAIGVPVPGGAISLLDEHGAPIDAPGIEGELVYAGPNVMMGYGLKRADLAGGAELTELRTGDLAVLNADGLYTITGRKSRFIKPFGLRIGLDDIEARLRQAGIAAAVAGDDTGLQIAAVAPASAEAVADLVLRHHDLPAASIQVIQLPEIPRLPSGKIDYAGIRGMFAARAAATRLSEQRLSLHAAFAGLLGHPDLGRDQSFASAGGDSLNYINASLLIEEHLNFLPEGWEQMTIRELEAIPRRRPAMRPSRRARRNCTSSTRSGPPSCCWASRSMQPWPISTFPGSSGRASHRLS